LAEQVRAESLSTARQHEAAKRTDKARVAELEAELGDALEKLQKSRSKVQSGSVSIASMRAAIERDEAALKAAMERVAAWEEQAAQLRRTRTPRWHGWARVWPRSKYALLTPPTRCKSCNWSARILSRN
jgi:hypothetical protein